jgi:hypothetical protein
MFNHKTGRKKLFFSTVVLMGFLDLITTFIGIVSFGAVEVNPLLSGLTQASLELLVAVKSSTVLLTGFLFYKGASIAELNYNSQSIGMRFLDFGYFAALTFLTVVVTNNIIIIFKLA